MSDDKQTDLTKATADKTDMNEAPKSATIPPAGLSSNAASIPPPPVSGAGTVPPPPVSGAGSIRAPRLPTPSVRPSAPSRPNLSDEDIFSIFKTQATGASETAAAAAQAFERTPAPPSVKPPSQLGTPAEEREITRSRQIPIDQDLFNLSAELFSNSQRPPVVGPDMSALTGLSDKGSAKDAGTLDDLLFTPAPTAPVASLDSIDKLAPKAPVFEPADKPSSRGSNRTVLFVGIAAALLSAGGMFLYMRSSAPNQPTASLQPTATTEIAPDTRPGQPAPTTEAQARPATVDKPQEAPVAAVDPTAAAAAGTGAPTEAHDKPGAVGSPDKPGTPDKPAEPEASAKPPEPEPPPAAPTSTEPAKPPTLAEAIAAAAGPGKSAAPAPGPAPAETTAPPAAAPAGPEFNKAAATAALNGAAGAAAGCKAPGDPSGQARVSITFAPSGRATRAIVSGPPFAGTATGSCVAAAFRSLSIPPFSGDPVTVAKSVSIP